MQKALLASDTEQLLLFFVNYLFPFAPFFAFIRSCNLRSSLPLGESSWVSCFRWRSELPGVAGADLAGVHRFFRVLRRHRSRQCRHLAWVELEAVLVVSVVREADWA